MNENTNTNNVEEKVYEREVKTAVDTLHKMEETVNDLKVSYGYTELKASFVPYKMQEQIEIIDKMNLRRALKNDWTGHMMNYGTFMTVMKNFDTFEKNENELKEQAMRIVVVERAIRNVNDYIKANRELLPRANFVLESPEIFSLAHEYLKKIPLFDTFNRQEYRTAIIRQAMLDLPKSDMEKAVTRNVIKAGDVKTLNPIVSSVSKEEAARYKENFEFLTSVLLKQSKEVNAGKKTDFIDTRVVGVSFSNEDGIKRQDIIKEIPTNSYPVPVGLVKGEYKGKPSIAVEWNKKQIGFVPQDVVNILMSAYPNSPLKGSITEVTGGFEKKTRDGKSQVASLGCSLHIEVDLVKENVSVSEKEKNQQMEKKETKSEDKIEKESEAENKEER